MKLKSEGVTQVLLNTMAGLGVGRLDFHYLINSMLVISQALETEFFDTYAQPLHSKLIHGGFTGPFHRMYYTYEMYEKCNDLFEQLALYDR